MINICELTSLTMKDNEMKNFPAGLLSYGALLDLLLLNFVVYQ